MSTILFNNIRKDTTVLNFRSENIWNDLPNINSSIFIPENYSVIQIDETYNFRPDKLAYELYQNDFYYPLLFYPNHIGSILQFNINIIGTNIYYLPQEFISKLVFQQF